MPGLRPTYTLRPVLLAILLMACSDDDKPGGGGVDAAGETRRACQASDCPMSRPSLRCDAGTPQFSCERGLADQCEWTNPRCVQSGDAAPSSPLEAGGDADPGPITDGGADAPAPDGPGDADPDAVDADADAGLPLDVVAEIL